MACLLALTVPSKGFSSCGSFLNPLSQDEALDQLVEMETHIDNLMTGQASNVWERAYALKTRLNKQTQGLTDYSIFVQSSQFKTLKNDLLNLETEIERPTKPPESANSDWEDVISNPETVKADFEYRLQILSGQMISVHFNSKVVDEIFKSKNSLHKIASAKFLKAIQKGWVSSPQSSGLKRLAASSDVIEIRILGSQMAFRIGGYSVGDHIYFVYSTNRSDHNGSLYLKSFIENVRGRRK